MNIVAAGASAGWRIARAYALPTVTLDKARAAVSAN